MFFSPVSLKMSPDTRHSGQALENKMFSSNIPAGGIRGLLTFLLIKHFLVHSSATIFFISSAFAYVSMFGDV